MVVWYASSSVRCCSRQPLPRHDVIDAGHMQRHRCSPKELSYHQKHPRQLKKPKVTMSMRMQTGSAVISSMSAWPLQPAHCSRSIDGVVRIEQLAPGGRQSGHLHPPSSIVTNNSQVHPCYRRGGGSSYFSGSTLGCQSTGPGFDPHLWQRHTGDCRIDISSCAIAAHHLIAVLVPMSIKKK